MSKIKFHIGLRLKFILVMLLAAGASFSLFHVSNIAVENALYNYFEKTDFSARESYYAAKRLQQYVTDNQIASTDFRALNQWDEENPRAYFIVMTDKQILYDPDFDEYTDREQMGQSLTEPATEAMTDDALQEADDRYYIKYLKQSTPLIHRMQFADGEREVYLYVYAEYRFYQAASIAEVVLSAFLFLVIVLIFLESQIRSIRQLERDVRILEGGALEHPVQITGNDELGDLARGLEQMRLSLWESMKKNEDLMAANSSLITSISHDLRTPLTALILYSEFVAEGKYKDEHQMRGYLRKLHDKALQIKTLSDKLFSDFYKGGDGWESAPQLVTEQISYAMESPLSDLVMYLNGQGVAVEASPQWPEGRIQITQDYLNRIFDNLASNILKYADRRQPVRLTMERREQRFVIHAVNSVCAKKMTFLPSTGIGLQNIRKMMERMGGTCEYRLDRRIFQISLGFRIVD